MAHDSLFLSVLNIGLTVWVLGLAVALIQMRVPDVAVHMFIFYYAVLSKVSPSTTLLPFAAAAITSGTPFKTMMITWKYTLPAFVVPFMFTLNIENGINLLALGKTSDIILATMPASLAIVVIAAWSSNRRRGWSAAFSSVG